MPSNDVFASMNVASIGMGSATLPNPHKESMGSSVGSGTSYSIRNLSYRTNEMNHYKQNTLAQELNSHCGNGGLIGGHNNMFPSANNVGPSRVAPLRQSFHSQQSINEGEQDISNFYYENNLNVGQVTHQ